MNGSAVYFRLILFLWVSERRLSNAWMITDEHRLATILHPKLKNFDCCPLEKNSSIEALKLVFDKYESVNSSILTQENIDNNTDSSSTLSVYNVNPSLKKNMNLLAQCFDSPSVANDQHTNRYQEIYRYSSWDVIANGCQDKVHGDVNVLLYWKEQKDTFPILSSIARNIYSIPTSNTTVERLFSSSKNIVSQRRTSLDCEKLLNYSFYKRIFQHGRK